MHWDALFISIMLSWRLYKVFVSLTTRRQTFAHLYQVYRKHTFRRVGPPKDILRMYAVWFLLDTPLKPHILTYLPIVFSRGFGQHPAVLFHVDQRDGTLDRSTIS